MGRSGPFPDVAREVPNSVTAGQVQYAGTVVAGVSANATRHTVMDVGVVIGGGECGTRVVINVSLVNNARPDFSAAPVVFHREDIGSDGHPFGVGNEVAARCGCGRDGTGLGDTGPRCAVRL